MPGALQLPQATAPTVLPLSSRLLHSGNRINGSRRRLPWRQRSKQAGAKRLNLLKCAHFLTPNLFRSVREGVRKRGKAGERRAAEEPADRSHSVVHKNGMWWQGEPLYAVLRISLIKMSKVFGSKVCAVDP